MTAPGGENGMTAPGGETGLGMNMDPRIRRRRNEVTREEGRRRLRVVAASVAVMLVVALAVAATRSPLLDVDRVELAGATQTRPVEVASVTGLGRHPLMVEVDPPTVARRVEALPWVRRAVARKRWPGTVVVEVTERVPAALVAAGDGRWGLVDGSGRVLAVVAARPAGLPALVGGPAAGRPGTSIADRAGAPLRVAAALPARLRARVAEVVGRADGTVDLALGPSRGPGAGGSVRLGPPHQLGAKLAAAQAVLDTADLTRLAVVDVRVPRAPVLTRR